MESSKDSSPNNNIILQTSDNEKIELEPEIAKKSNLLLGYLQDDSNHKEPIQLSEIKSDILQKVIEYLTYYKKKTPREIPKPMPSSDLCDFLDDWDVQFINSVNLDSVFDLINAANFMDIPSLIDLGCAKIGSLMKGKTAKEIKSMFNADCDLTDEEIKEFERYQI